MPFIAILLLALLGIADAGVRISNTLISSHWN